MAALIASVIVPMIELALMFLAARYFARPLAGKNEARLVILFLMFTTVLNHLTYTLAGFHLGEASHHAWYGILNVLMFGAAARIVLGVAGLAPRLMLALALALLLAVGIEGFPMIAGTIGVFSILSWVFRKELLAQRGAEAVACGALLSLLLLPMHVPPDQWLAVSFSQPSIIGPVMLAVAALFLLLQTHIVKHIQNRAITVLLLMAMAGLFLWGLVLAFPDILEGATAGLSPSERDLAANEHPEVWTMWRSAGDASHYILLVIPTLIALVTGVSGMAATGNVRRRMMIGAYTGFALIPGALAQVYFRYIHHAQTAACPLLLYAWQRLRARWPQTVSYRFVSLFAFLALGPFWMVLLPAVLDKESFFTQVLFFPAKIYTEPFSCATLSMTTNSTRIIRPAR